MGRTYQQLLSILPEKSGLAHGSLRQYASHCRKITDHNHLTLDSIVLPEHFKFLGYINNGLSNSAMSGCKTLYRVFIESEIADRKMSLIESLEYCATGFFDTSLLSCYGVKPDNIRDIISKLRCQSIPQSVVERAFCLPRNFLDIIKILEEKCISDIPSEWFVGTKKCFKNPAKLEAIKHEFWGENIDPSDPRAKVIFDAIVTRIENNNYHSGSRHAIKEHKELIGYVPYYLEGQRKAEFNRLEKHKRSRKMIVSGKGWESSATVNIGLRKIERFYSYILNVHGKRFSIDDLNLGLFAVEELLTGYLDYWRDVTGSYDLESIAVVNFARSILNRKDGWLEINQEYQSKLQDIGVECSEWYSYCLDVSIKLNEYRSFIRRDLKVGRDSKQKFSKILDDDAPLRLYLAGVDEALADLEEKYEVSREFAYKAQDFLLATLLGFLPLRARNWAEMKFDPAWHKGGIRKMEGQLFIYVDAKEIKNGRSNVALANAGCINYPLSEVADAQKYLPFLLKYLNELRPLINDTEYLFCTKSLSTVDSQTIGYMVQRWSHTYLSSYSKFPSRIAGLPKFNTHLVRAIVATHFVKRGEIPVAAYLLADSETTIRRHYVRDDANQWFLRKLRADGVDYSGAKRVA